MSLFSKSDDEGKGELGVKNFKNLMTSFMNGPLDETHWRDFFVKETYLYWEIFYTLIGI